MAAADREAAELLLKRLDKSRRSSMVLSWRTAVKRETCHLQQSAARRINDKCRANETTLTRHCAETQTMPHTQRRVFPPAPSCRFVTHRVPLVYSELE